MAVFAVDNGPLADLNLSFETLPDTGIAQRVIAIPADDTPVALTAAQARWTCTSTVSISSKLPGAGESYLILEAQVADILYWLDGKDPSVTPGHLLPNGYQIRLAGASILSNTKVIQATAGAIGVMSAFKKPAT